MMVKSWEGRVLTNEGNAPPPRPEGRADMMAAGKDCAIADIPGSPDGSPDIRWRPDRRPGKRIEGGEGRVLTNESNERTPRPEGRADMMAAGKDRTIADIPGNREGM